MQKNRGFIIVGVFALLVCFGAGSLAPTAAQTPAKKMSFLTRLKNSIKGPHTGPMARMMGGQIIGNKNSHVYHLPGDKGTLPAEKNRVYFRTEAQAKAAGYHLAGHPKMGSGSMGSGSMMHSMHKGSMHHATGSFGH